MPLVYPRAITLNDFNGGYVSKESFSSLQNNQTDDAENIEIQLDGGIKKRNGYRRLLNTALTTFNGSAGLKITTSSSGDVILGAFQIVKQSVVNDIKRTVVAAGTNLWNYNSQTATVIAQNLHSSNYWYFTQIQDPRSAADDVVIGVNGYDPPKLWNGVESSAVNLSAVSSATGVLPAKFIASLKNRVYLLNVVDDTDVDAKSKVLISGFSAQGAPRPQTFEQSFYVGGADKEGEITGGVVLHDQLIIFKRNSTYKFTPGSGRIIDTAQLVQMGEQIGCIAPGTIAVAGNTVIFLGELGVFAFDGNNFQYISPQIEPDLVNTSKKFIQNSIAVFYRAKNQYWLCVPDQGSDVPNKVLVYDVTKNIWFPPYTGFDISTISTILDQRDTQRIVFGNQFGYLNYADTGFADGVTGTFSGTITGITASGLVLEVTSTAFNITGDGMPVCKIRIESGTGLGKEFTVIGSTSSRTLRLSNADDATGLDSSSKFVLGGIKAHYRTKDHDFSAPDTDKKFRSIKVRVTQQGEFNLNVNYILDYKNITLAPTSTISLKQDAPQWGSSTYGTAIFQNTQLLTRKVVTRAISTQSLTGKTMALRFYNDRPFEPFEVEAFDIQLKEIGRR